MGHGNDVTRETNSQQDREGFIAKNKQQWGNAGALNFWAAVRGRSRILLLAAVFCLFSPVGLIALQMDLKRLSLGAILIYALLSGGFAVGYVGLAVARRVRYVPLVAVIHVAIIFVVSKMEGASPSLAGNPEALQRQLTILAGGAMLGIIAAYTLVMHFLRFEGQRYVQMRTEMALAAEIHSSLVPVCTAAVGGFEVYGASVPSGEVGGDLVDVVEVEGGWIGYVADVSGHGVQSGVLMAMFKTALRSEIARGGSPAYMLGEVHRTLFPLKMGNMFVTAAILQAGSDGKVLLASAGHPPVLHFRKRSGTVSEYPAMNPPVGIAERQEFSEAEIQCDAGDVLLVLTDGLTEVFDARGKELGLEPVKTALLASVDSPLEDLFSVLRNTALSFGPQTDDQTLLLARCGKN